MTPPLPLINAAEIHEIDMLDQDELNIRIIIRILINGLLINILNGSYSCNNLCNGINNCK